jgi:hypothetical protein
VFIMVIRQRTPESVAVTTELLLDRAAQVPPVQRRAMCVRLAATSPVFADWVRWTLWFPVLFSLGVLAQFGALLAISFRLSPVVPHILVLVGMVSLAVAGLRMWRVGRQAVDAAVGACLDPK